MNEPILRTEQLKAFYILEVHGAQKIAKAVNEIALEIMECVKRLPWKPNHRRRKQCNG